MIAKQGSQFRLCPYQRLPTAGLSAAFSAPFLAGLVNEVCHCLIEFHHHFRERRELYCRICASI